MIAGSLNPIMLGQVASGGATDPDFANVSLLLHGDGANASTTFTDSSSNNRLFSVLNNAQLTTANKQFGTASMSFDGTTDAIFTADQANLRMDAGDWTCEGWVYPVSAGAGTFRGIYSKRNSNATFREFTIYIDNTNKFNFLATTTGSTWGAVILSAAITHNTWIHFAFTRSGTTLYAFLNGVLISTSAYTGSLTASTENATIGALGSNGDFSFNGQIDDFRLTKGVCRYTANFTPPTAPYPDS
jgi:hypothetical protein